LKKLFRVWEKIFLKKKVVQLYISAKFDFQSLITIIFAKHKEEKPAAFPAVPIVFPLPGSCPLTDTSVLS
jgi:hypothetical protein